jgi:hypothetical protein
MLLRYWLIAGLIGDKRDRSGRFHYGSESVTHAFGLDHPRLDSSMSHHGRGSRPLAWTATGY